MLCSHRRSFSHAVFDQYVAHAVFDHCVGACGVVYTLESMYSMNALCRTRCLISMSEILVLCISRKACIQRPCRVTHSRKRRWKVFYHCNNAGNLGQQVFHEHSLSHAVFDQYVGDCGVVYTLESMYSMNALCRTRCLKSMSATRVLYITWACIT